MFNFRSKFERMFSTHNITYDIKGIITADRKIYALGTGSKTLSGDITRASSIALRSDSVAPT